MIADAKETNATEIEQKTNATEVERAKGSADDKSLSLEDLEKVAGGFNPQPDPPGRRHEGGGIS